MRKVEEENNKVTIGKTSAASSHEAMYYHLAAPATIRRMVQRLTSGARKYGSVNWRVGLNDAEYVRDRFNHLFEHMLKFMESGNTEDDNIGAMLWSLNCLAEVERLAPEALTHVVGITNLFGLEATKFHQEEMKRREKPTTSTNERTVSDRVRRPRRGLAKRR